MILYIVYLERKKSKDRENVRMKECANMIISLRSRDLRPMNYELCIINYQTYCAMKGKIITFVSQKSHLQSEHHIK